MSTDYAAVLKLLAQHRDNGLLSAAHHKRLRWQLYRCLKESGCTPPRNLPRPEVEQVLDSQGRAYCRIPAEAFMLGAEDEYSEILAPFYMAKFPVTVKEFLTFVAQSGYAYPEKDLNTMQRYAPHDGCPACNVSWQDAKAFCRWMRNTTCDYYALPNEAEWELAARGVDGRVYPWGAQKVNPQLACYAESPGAFAMRVGSHEHNQSPYGCMDMIGNIWEYCLDTFDDPCDPRVLRGGSWNTPGEQVNCVERILTYPADERIPLAGFRMVHMPAAMLLEYCQAYGLADPHATDVAIDPPLDSGSSPYVPYSHQKGVAERDFVISDTIRIRRRRPVRNAVAREATCIDLPPADF